MSIELEEFEPGRWRVKRRSVGFEKLKSDLPLPFLISDTMPETEQVDGKFYTSKRQYRAVGRAHGLIEVGNEKLPPKQRATADPNVKEVRKRAIHTAIQKYKAGVRSV
jgi:hypothetical protein